MSVVLYGLKTGDWTPLILRWRDVCLESFKRLPELPEPIRVSEYAKLNNLSNKEARQRLESLEHINLNRDYYIQYHPCVMNLIRLAKQHEQKFKVRICIPSLIQGIRKLRTANLTEPTNKEIEKLLGPYVTQKLVCLGVIKAIELPESYNRCRVFYYATNILLNETNWSAYRWRWWYERDR